MSSSKRLIVIIIGPPGSGKGTQGLLLAERLGLYYFEPSKIIEKKLKKAKPGEYVEFEGKRFSLDEQKRRFNEGEICESELVFHWMEEKIGRLAREDQDVIFSGTPRNIGDAKNVVPLLEKLYDKDEIKIIVLGLSAEQSIWRNSHRRICELVRHPILYNDETKNLKHCPLDGSGLMKRGKLDDPETIKIRLKEYEEKTLPMIDYLRERGFEIKEINAGDTPSAIFNNILKALGF